MIGDLVSKKDMGSSYLVEEQCWVIRVRLSYAPDNVTCEWQDLSLAAVSAWFLDLTNAPSE